MFDHVPRTGKKQGPETGPAEGQFGVRRVRHLFALLRQRLQGTLPFPPARSWPHRVLCNVTANKTANSPGSLQVPEAVELVHPRRRHHEHERNVEHQRSPAAQAPESEAATRREEHD